MNIMKRLFRPSREQRILRALANNGECYGLQLREALGIGVTIYNTLRWLEDDALLTSRESEERPKERGYRPRRLYRITSAGLSKLAFMEDSDSKGGR